MILPGRRFELALFFAGLAHTRLTTLATSGKRSAIETRYSNRIAGFRKESLPDQIE